MQGDAARCRSPEYGRWLARRNSRHTFPSFGSDAVRIYALTLCVLLALGYLALDYLSSLAQSITLRRIPTAAIEYRP